MASHLAVVVKAARRVAEGPGGAAASREPAPALGTSSDHRRHPEPPRYHRDPSSTLKLWTGRESGPHRACCDPQGTRNSGLVPEVSAGGTGTLPLPGEGKGRGNRSEGRIRAETSGKVNLGVPEVCRWGTPRGPPDLATHHPARPQSWGVRTSTPQAMETWNGPPAGPGGPAGSAHHPARQGPGSEDSRWLCPRCPTLRAQAPSPRSPGALGKRLTDEKTRPRRGPQWSLSPHSQRTRAYPSPARGRHLGEATARAGTRNSCRGPWSGT